MKRIAKAPPPMPVQVVADRWKYVSSALKNVANAGGYKAVTTTYVAIMIQPSHRPTPGYVDSQSHVEPLPAEGLRLFMTAKLMAGRTLQPLTRTIPGEWLLPPTRMGVSASWTRVTGWNGSSRRN